MTNVYGPHTTTQKVGFIKTLWKINQGVEGRDWILGGDFNMIIDLEEKKGGRRRLDGESVLFKESIEEMGMVDIISREEIYTWNNRRGGERHIASLLDRFLIFESILDLGSELSSLVLLSTGSLLVCMSMVEFHRFLIQETL